jgi:hypothetical protein
MDWELLAATSHAQTAIAIRAKLQRQEYGAARHGVEERIDGWARAAKRAFESYLSRLRPHVITWKLQPERHSRSGLRTIRHGRQAIRKLQQAAPSRTHQLIRAHRWDDGLESAVGEAAGDMDCDLPALTLPGQEGFANDYRLDS